MEPPLELPPQDRAFLDRARAACDRAGDQAVLLLVGSRAAGFAGPGADLDLWIVGNGALLDAAEQAALRRDGQLFVDRGDMRAHWSFFDRTALERRLAAWPDEMLWVLANARPLHGNAAAARGLQERFAAYPDEVARAKLEWLVGGCRSLFSSYPKSGPTKKPMSLVVGGKLVECLYKLCCVGHRRPFPYTKWLAAVAGQTDLGRRVLPHIDAALGHMQQSPFLPPDALSPDWGPRQALRRAFDAGLEGLGALGWKAPWLDNPWLAAAAYMGRPAP